MSRILVVEDDPAAREVVEHALSQERLQTVGACDGQEALRYLRESEPFDLVVLDLILPGRMDGYSVCQEIRAGAAGEKNKDVAVLMLSARDDETSVVVGLEVGADDYITKPFRPRELVSRARAHLRRRQPNLRSPASSSSLEFPGLHIDLLRWEVKARGELISLTPCQFKVLAFLASSSGQVFTRRQIMCHLWDGNFFGEPRAADVHVQHIRSKIEPDPKNPRFVQTVREMGYRFADLS